MSRNLIIVESPAKIRTIREIVGRQYEIRASIGHIRDIPTSSLGVDIENGFRMNFVTVKGKGRAIGEIKSAASKADHVYIATDPDREGEAIAWHVSQLVPADVPVERIKFNAITRSEIQQALRTPGQINQHLVDAQFARRIVDRLIGYILSPEATRHLGETFSVGRVQSPAVALIVEREREIRAFVPEPYWLIKALYNHHNTQFAAGLKSGRVKDEAEAGRIVEAVRSASSHEVSDVIEDEVLKNPPPPFITSTFQRAAFKAFRLGSQQAMRVAQNLYEGMEISGKHVALITYMRTDSPRISAEGMTSAKDQVAHLFGAHYYQRRAFRGKAGAQDAHEAIRPAHPEITPEMAKQHLDKRHFQVYDLIYKRWLASQMKPAAYKRVRATIAAGGVELEAVGITMTFEGFLKAYGADLNEQEKDEEGADKRLPPLAKGDTPEFVSVDSEKKMTQPPSRYNNGSLVETLEKLGIGRPSTYAAIVQRIQDTAYVEENGPRREFVPTPKGEKLFDYLKQYRSIVIDYEYTNRMEAELDEVEEGKKPYLDVVKEEFERVKDAYEAYKESGGGWRDRKPTASQLALVKRISTATNIQPPDEALEDGKKLSDWIDQVKDTAGLSALPPSEKQLAFAESLARDTGETLSEELRTDSAKLSKFIDRAKKVLEQKLSAKSREFIIKYLSDDGAEMEFEKTQVVDVVDNPEKKAIALRLTPRVTKWIPRSQIARLTDITLTLKNKWAAENVYGSAAKAAQAGRRGWRRGPRKPARTAPRAR